MDAHQVFLPGRGVRVEQCLLVWCRLCISSLLSLGLMDYCAGTKEPWCMLISQKSSKELSHTSACCRRGSQLTETIRSK